MKKRENDIIDYNTLCVLSVFAFEIIRIIRG